jgi:selenocysteine lyase/cysteine desulfurase
MFCREICLGSSSTQLLFNLSQAMEPTLPQGSEIILTNCDHETNIGCWHAMAQKSMPGLNEFYTNKKGNLIVRDWKINKETFELETETLATLLNENTSLIAMTHCSNVLGTINPVEEYVKIIRASAPKAIIVIDGVALAAHRFD